MISTATSGIVGGKKGKKKKEHDKVEWRYGGKTPVVVRIQDAGREPKLHSGALKIAKKNRHGFGCMGLDL